MACKKSSRIVRSLSARLVAAWVVGVSLSALAACAGSGGAPQHAKVQPGNMPTGGDWNGVFYNPTFGHLHMVKDGDGVNGRWRNAAGDKTGSLAGKVTGDVLRFEWREYKVGMVGPSATQTGKGYFRYVVPPGENTEHELHGEWGLGADEAGRQWNCVKQRNTPPDLDSVGADETESVRGGGWDEPNQAPASGSGGGDDKEKATESEDW